MTVGHMEKVFWLAKVTFGNYQNTVFVYVFCTSVYVLFMRLCGLGRQGPPQTETS